MHGLNDLESEMEGKMFLRAYLDEQEHKIVRKGFYGILKPSDKRSKKVVQLYIAAIKYASIK